MQWAVLTYAEPTRCTVLTYAKPWQRAVLTYAKPTQCAILTYTKPADSQYWHRSYCSPQLSSLHLRGVATARGTSGTSREQAEIKDDRPRV
eukprot:3396768-Rhodomonas_salina.1